MKSAENTLHIMELIAEHQPISLAGLCELIPQPKSTIQRGVNTLREFGWIKPSNTLGHPSFELSYRFLSLASTNSIVNRLSQIAKPYLIEIRDFCNETTFLSTYDVDHMTVIDCIDSKHAVRMVGATGGNLPAYITSTGKACLALLSQPALEKIVKLQLKKDKQIAFSRLQTELKQIKQQGYAMSIGEFSAELSHIGCAIVDANNFPIGGLGVSIANHRYAEIDEAGLIKKITNACKEISLALQTE